jgi:hypothetical protein
MSSTRRMPSRTFAQTMGGMQDPQGRSSVKSGRASVQSAATTNGPDGRASVNSAASGSGDKLMGRNAFEDARFNRNQDEKMKMIHKVFEIIVHLRLHSISH